MGQCPADGPNPKIFSQLIPLSVKETSAMVAKGGVNPEIPGPAPAPLFGWRGNLLRYFRDPIRTMAQARERYGDLSCLAQGGNDSLIFQPLPQRSATLFAFGAANNRQVLTQPDLFESDVMRAPRQCPWLGDNMASANGSERLQQRRTMMPALTSEHLKAYHPYFVQLTDAMLDRWEVGQTLNLTDEIESLTSAIASQTFYGQVLGEDPDALASLARQVAKAMFSPINQLPINLPGTPYRRFENLSKRAETSVLAEIERRRQGDSDGDDILSMMLRAIDEGNVGISQRHLVGNAFTLFLAGHDVPANALGWTLYLLAQHPEVMADLLDELDEALGGEPPTYAQVFKLPLLDRVIRESMRVLSPAIILWRRTSAPTELNGYDIPVGSEVILSPYITHVDEDLFPRPLRFDPQRWETGKKPSAFEFLPFSYGARKCLGAAFAEIQLRITVAMIVQRFRLELIPDTQVDLSVTMTMKPKDGLPVIVRPQDRHHTRSKAPQRGAIGSMVDIDF